MFLNLEESIKKLDNYYFEIKFTGLYLLNYMAKTIGWGTIKIYVDDKYLKEKEEVYQKDKM